MKIYISGRIKNSNNAERQFANAEQWLIDKGYTPINPLKLHNAYESVLSEEEMVGIELNLLSMSNGIFLLNGWQDSKDCVLANKTARALGKVVLYQNYFNRCENEGTK